MNQPAGPWACDIPGCEDEAVEVMACRYPGIPGLKALHLCGPHAVEFETPMLAPLRARVDPGCHSDARKPACLEALLLTDYDKVDRVHYIGPDSVAIMACYTDLGWEYE